MPINKVQYGDRTLIDITDTTATPDTVIQGFNFYAADGSRVTGSLGDATPTSAGLMSIIDKIKLDNLNVYCGTTAEWGADISFVPAKGAIIIYSDYSSRTDPDTQVTTYIPNLKIGDGNAYLVDLPFVETITRDEVLSFIQLHASDFDLHTTAAEKAFWNNKLNYSLDGENLILNRL